MNYLGIVDARAVYYPVAYRFVKELGRGRQGIVFLGLRHGARGCITRHAIKLFDPRIYPSAKKYWTDMGRIAQQTSRLQRVRNPHLVSRDIYDESNGIGYAQMEVVDGVDLQGLLSGRHLPAAKERCTPAEWARITDALFRIEGGKVSIQPGVALYIMRQTLRGLEALHAEGFIHSDVKPANVMVDSLGYVKVVDFGRAVRIHERPSIILGSPFYMAPEIHRREPGTPQTDLYSVGLVGLELLRGRPLDDGAGGSEKDLLDAKSGLLPRLPELLPEHVRRNDLFVHVLRRFLDPNPARRYASAREAEIGKDGLAVLHRQLTFVGKDTEYGRELENYISRIKRPGEDEDAGP